MSEETPAPARESRAYVTSKARAILIRARYAKHPDRFEARALEAARELLAAVKTVAKAAEYDVKESDRGLSLAMSSDHGAAVLLRIDQKDGLLFEYGFPPKVQATDIEYDPVHHRFVETADRPQGPRGGPKDADDNPNASHPPGKKEGQAPRKRRNALTVVAEALGEVMKS